MIDKIDCYSPTCKYNQKTKKCVKPNPYIETMAMCKRNNIKNCKEKWEYDKGYHTPKVCEYFNDRAQYQNVAKHIKKTIKSCKAGEEISPKSGRCVKKCNKDQERNMQTGRCRKIKNEKNKLSTHNTHFADTNNAIDNSNRLSLSSTKSQSNIKDKIAKWKMGHQSPISPKRLFGIKKIPNTYRVKRQNKTVKIASSPQIISSPRMPKSSPRMPNSSPRMPKVSPRMPKSSPRMPKSSPRMPKVSPRMPKSSPRMPKSSPRMPKSSPRMPKVSPRMPKSSPRMPKVSPRMPKSSPITKYNKTLEERILHYQHVLDIIKEIDINSCLKTDYLEYNINDNVILRKQIGTKSKYAVIYLTTIKSYGDFAIATKLMNDRESNLSELKINNMITQKIIIDKFSRHFILSYTNLLCTDKSHNVPELIQNKKYLISFSELADGDLKMLCHNKKIVNNNVLMYNLMIQTIFSIATFHNLGYIHNDCHWGNFLYIKTNVNDNEYYHYIIANTHIYLKNCGYNIIINDFGKAKKYSHTDNSSQDYSRIINVAFINTKNGGYNKYLNDTFSIYARKLSDKINNVNNSHKILNKLTNNMKYLSSFNNKILIYKNELPPNSIILNSKPFIIY
jgi:hypothetical protein